MMGVNELWVSKADAGACPDRIACLTGSSTVPVRPIGVTINTSSAQFLRQPPKPRFLLSGWRQNLTEFKYACCGYVRGIGIDPDVTKTYFSRRAYVRRIRSMIAFFW